MYYCGISKLKWNMIWKIIVEIIRTEVIRHGLKGNDLKTQNWELNDANSN